MTHRLSAILCAMLATASCTCPPPDPQDGECEQPLTPPDVCSVSTECDDANDCTADFCSVGMCAVEVLIDGSPCGANGGECMGGICCHP